MRIPAAAIALALGACTIADGDYFGRIPTPDPRHFRWCNSGEPEFIDPALATSTTDMPLVNALFDGLTTNDPDGLPAPSLATRWEVSPDRTVFTFHLRPDARWSNGRALGADDFVYSIARVLHPATASRNAETLWKVKHGKAYNTGVARLLLADRPPLAAGDVVELVEVAPPDPNARRTTAPTPLHAAPDAGAEAFATVRLRLDAARRAGRAPRGPRLPRQARRRRGGDGEGARPPAAARDPRRARRRPAHAGHHHRGADAVPRRPHAAARLPAHAARGGEPLAAHLDPAGADRDERALPPDLLAPARQVRAAPVGHVLGPGRGAARARGDTTGYCRR